MAQVAVNPYIYDWEVYFEQRLAVMMADNLRGRRSLLFLWKEQPATSPVCDQPITELTGWHNHHIVWRTHGGPDTTANREARITSGSSSSRRGTVVACARCPLQGETHAPDSGANL